MSGWLTLINFTPYTWHNIYSHSYQLTQWDFPSIVSPGQMVSAQVELQQGFTTSSVDDKGEVAFSVSKPSESAFQISLTTDGGGTPYVTVAFDGLNTSTNAEGTSLSLGSMDDTYLPFILGGSDELGYTSNRPLDNWMHANLPNLGCEKLQHLCIPGSHNAGMSQLNAHTFWATSANTVAQSLGMYDQLRAGARYFDIRPVYHNQAWWTGHYQYLDIGVHDPVQKVVGWQGANGQSIESIIDDVNQFTATNQELIILWLSHGMNRDDGYSLLSQAEGEDLMTQLGSIKHLIHSNSTLVDWSTWTLSDLIHDSPGVIVILDAPGVRLGDFYGRGFYKPINFPLYDNYADSDNLATMQKDQYSKMLAQRKTPDSPEFLLSWTLTMSGTDFVFGSKTGIKSLAAKAYSALFQGAGSTSKVPYTSPYLWTTSKTFPNILLIDDIRPDRWLTALTIGMSRHYSSCK